MRLLICSINFSPELTSTGKYTGETALWLANHGIDVRVITAPPYYPAWRVANDYSASQYRIEQIRDNLRVFRCPLWVPKNPSGIKRLVHLASFALASLPVLAMQIRWRPDIVMVIEPPIFSAPGCLLLSKLCSAKAWLHIQDYEVDAAFSLGMLKGSVLKRSVACLERRLMRSFDRVSSITSAMLGRAVNKGVDQNRLIYFPNWANLEQIKVLDRTNPEVAEFMSILQIPEDAFVALYAGNIGNKQGIEIVADAAERLSEKTCIFFVCCGTGSGLVALRQRCRGLTNVRFLDAQPAEKFSALLGVASVHLLPQKAHVADLVMPSKLTGMMASGRPTIATAELGTAVANVVEGCGMLVSPGDVDAFCRAILALKKDPGLCKKLGEEARAWAEANLDQDKILAGLLDDLQELSVQ